MRTVMLMVAGWVLFSFVLGLLVAQFIRAGAGLRDADAEPERRR